MKLKKIVSLAAAAILSVSAITASAATVPVATNNDNAIALATEFYNDGLYLEAQQMLGQVISPTPGQAAQVVSLANLVQFQLDRWNIGEFLRQAREFYAQNNYRQAIWAVWMADRAPATKTENEYQAIAALERSILTDMGIVFNDFSAPGWYSSAPEGMDAQTAIWAVIDWEYNFGSGAFALTSQDQRFSAVWVPGDDNGSPARWDVYIQQLTLTGWVDIHAYRVYNYSPMTIPTNPTVGFPATPASPAGPVYGPVTVPGTIPGVPTGVQQIF